MTSRSLKERRNDRRVFSATAYVGFAKLDLQLRRGKIMIRPWLTLGWLMPYRLIWAWKISFHLPAESELLSLIQSGMEFLVPNQIVIDNGSVFQGRGLRRLCVDKQINLVTSDPLLPDNLTIERVFQRLNSLLSNLPRPNFTMNHLEKTLQHYHFSEYMEA